MNDIVRVLSKLLEKDGMDLLMRTVKETVGHGDPTLGFLCGMFDGMDVDLIADTEYGKRFKRDYLPGRCVAANEEMLVRATEDRLRAA